MQKSAVKMCPISSKGHRVDSFKYRDSSTNYVSHFPDV